MIFVKRTAILLLMFCWIASNVDVVWCRPSNCCGCLRSFLKGLLSRHSKTRTRPQTPEVTPPQIPEVTPPQIFQPVRMGYKIGNAAVYELQEREGNIEDRYAVLQKQIDRQKFSFYAVFEGHDGEFAAEYAVQNLLRQLYNYIATQKHTKKISNPSDISLDQSDYKKWLNEAISLFDKDVCNKAEEEQNDSGTTAIVALEAEDQLFVANLGDSRGVICDHEDNPIQLSVDQILMEKQDGADATTVANGKALGYYKKKREGVYDAVPAITTFDLSQHKPKFLILASRGLWETFDRQTAIQFIREKIEKKDPMLGAQKIALKAYEKKSKHNITVMVIDFSDRNWESV